MRRRSLLPLLLTTLLAPAATAAAPGDVTVHLDKEDALAKVFPDADRVVELRHLLSRDELAGIEDALGARLDEGGFYLYAGLADGTPRRFAAIVSQIGKVRPITHIVAVDPDGEVADVAVMIYRESHGDEVADERFMAQYRGKSIDDPVRIDHDIINIAGATLSGHAICRGVRKSLAVVDEVFLARDADALDALLAGGEDVTPAALAANRGTSVLAAAAPHAVETALPGGCEPGADGSLRLEREIMGTVCAVEAFPEPGALDVEALAEAMDAALDEVARWDGVLSDWRDDTPLSELNATPVGRPYRPGDDLLRWLEDARRWAAETDGAFDPAVGALVEAWSLRSREPHRPDADALTSARDASGLRHFRVEDGAVVRLHDGARLDPGASGKGYALDRAGEVLRRHGVRSALLSFRSTMLALGPPPGARAWRIPIVHDGPGRDVDCIELAEGALSVSGGALRAYDDAGTARGHVLDVRSGVPVEADRLAWVRHASAAASDALATALLVEGPVLDEVDGASGGYLPAADADVRPWPTSP